MKKLSLLLLLLGSSAYGAATSWKTNAHGSVRLIVPYRTAPDQGIVYVGFHFKPAPGWMLYWKQPGDAGFPPKFDFKGTHGLKDPQILWPRPKVFVLPGGIKEYGYDQEVVYPVQAQAVPAGGRLHIAVTVTYLTCQESCVPYKYDFSLDLPQAAVPQPDEDIEPLLQKFIGQVPPEGEEAVPTAPQSVQGESLGVLWILLFGFIGGMILNVMPCVLPVLSIKLFGLLEHARRERQVIVHGALASAAGIIVSFLAGGAIAVLARQAGNAVGWGIQFQNPVFVSFLAVVVTLFALNLWGLFEVTLPPMIGRLGAVAGHSDGVVSYFVSGLLATLLATPCSAPFLGTAVGFALSQPAAVVMGMFLAAGVGMAVPYLALAVFPSTLQWLPKPGVWMVHIRMILGFVLAATVVWLGYVLSNQVSPAGMAYFYLGLLGLGAIAWSRQSVMMSRYRDSAMMALGIWLLIGVVSAGVLVIANASRQARSTSEAESSAWQPFAPEKIPGLLQSGKSVFVDVTADWCFTCKYNEKFILNSSEVTRAFREQNIVLMKADWTNHNAAIGDYLKSFNRYGIPFYALYRPGQPPVVFPELLTQNKILKALQN